MVFGCVHNDHDDHLYYHLLISANEVGFAKKTRLSKAQFSHIKKQIEQNVLSRYPELEQTVVMSKGSSDESEKFTAEKLSRKAGEQKRRTERIPQRDALKAKLKNLFEQAESKDAFFAGLSEAQFELYIRGKTVGVKDLQNDRKHRLKTLGLLAEFETCSKRIELDEVKKSTSAKPKRARKSSETEVIQERVQRKIEMEQIRGQQSQSDSQSQNSSSQDSSSHRKK